MSRKIEHLYESPCFKCGKMQDCDKKIANNLKFMEVMDSVMPQADYDYHNCGIWIALQGANNEDFKSV